ncbi:MAG: response regulator [Candidatus Margulisiibacteriota bacterium]|jgi:response regulator RpfG family c-di-GMP phosphodiesterase
MNRKIITLTSQPSAGTSAPNSSKDRVVIKNVLIIEDEPIIVSSIKMRLLRRYPKLKLFVAATISLAMKIYQTRQIDLAILDQDLGEEGSGLEFIKRIRPKDQRLLLAVYGEKNKYYYYNVEELVPNVMLERDHRLLVTMLAKNTGKLVFAE